MVESTSGLSLSKSENWKVLVTRAFHGSTAHNASCDISYVVHGSRIYEGVSVEASVGLTGEGGAGQRRKLGNLRIKFER